jgi:serine/threonine-protein kinase
VYVDRIKMFMRMRNASSCNSTLSSAPGCIAPSASCRITRAVIKRVLADYSRIPEFATMFINEAQLASQLQHENIVNIVAFDKDADGRLFIVMEFVEGKDLAALLATGPLPASIAVFICLAMLRGLQHAHARGVIHRDISPHNVLLSWEGGVKVSDFGIAKATDAEGKVQSMVLKGKPAYMSPEQANQEVIDARSDLFAVGIVLWEVLTGRRLFNGSMRDILVLRSRLDRCGRCKRGKRR